MPLAERDSLGGGRGLFRQAFFEFENLTFQGFEASAGACEHNHLAVEFVAADQIELAEGALQQRLELRFELFALNGALAIEQSRSMGAEGIEQGFGRQHGLIPVTVAAESIMAPEIPGLEA